MPKDLRDVGVYLEFDPVRDPTDGSTDIEGRLWRIDKVSGDETRDSIFLDENELRKLSQLCLVQIGAANANLLK